MSKFARLLTFGPNNDLRMELRPRHRDYLARLLAEGKLYASGPWVDESGALIVYEAATLDDARALVEQDPYGEGGIDVIAKSELNEWRVIYAASASS